jgi:hypothetical protein
MLGRLLGELHESSADYADYADVEKKHFKFLDYHSDWLNLRNSRNLRISFLFRRRLLV